MDQETGLHHFVAEIGLFFEAAGSTRMAGRMLGWLLVCDPPHQSAGQLAAALHASNGSISMTTRMLIQAGLVDRVSLRGDRRTYYRLRPHAWTRLVTERNAQVIELRKLAEQGIGLLADDPPARRERLEDMRELFAYFEDAFPGLLAGWEERQRQQQHDEEGR